MKIKEWIEDWLLFRLIFGKRGSNSTPRPDDTSREKFRDITDTYDCMSEEDEDFYDMEEDYF